MNTNFRVIGKDKYGKIIATFVEVDPVNLSSAVEFMIVRASMGQGRDIDIVVELMEADLIEIDCYLIDEVLNREFTPIEA